MNHPLFGLLGVALILFVAFMASNNKRAISPRIVLSCFALQVLIAILVLYVPLGKDVLQVISAKVITLLSYATAGIEMIFGGLADESLGFSFLVRVLPVVIFFSALMEVLYHMRVMQLIVRFGGKAMHVLTGTKPIESLNVVANIFVGQTEAPLTLKPYLPGISRHELFTIMVSGLASIAGTVMAGYIQLGISPEYLIAASFMSAPAGLLMAKIIMPDPKVEAGDEEEFKDIFTLGKTTSHPNVIMAAAVGAQNGVALAVGIGAMLLAFVSLIAMCNGLLGYFGSFAGFEDLTIQSILGLIFAPVMYVINVPWAEAQQAGAIFGEKVVLNEFIAYISLTNVQGDLSPRTVVILTFALCGFANFSSIAILLGGLGALIPDRMADIAKMGLKAVFAASLANLMSAALAGILVGF
ncbi:NupC/NupG family nucleoside CNT transporter [Robiginitomaculum antarcticum]|uniref:NupC/NupG family nucleoside CNT transporter n=1 Tax=Robiginitomaculum antarcticum TaxID=437507 RepID=UPI00037C0DC0|nr:nucleoside transporter C-terminal domain-containing protein [Robiginitomaculum antarcticum]